MSAWPGMPAPSGMGEDAFARRWFLNPADAAEVLRARGTEHRLRCAVQLCTLRASGRFIADYRRVPIEAANHLAAQLGLDPLLFLPEPERPATETAQLQRVRQHLGWGEFDNAAEQGLRSQLQERAAEGALPGPLLALAEDHLRAAHVVLPAASTLERLVASVSAHAAQDLFERIAAGLPERLRDAMEDLVDVPDGEHRSPLAHLKEPPPAARASLISAHLARLHLVEGLLGADVDLSAATPQLVQHLAQLGRRYDVQALKRFAAPKRHALVAAFLVETRKGLLDQAVAMHDQYIACEAIGGDARLARRFDEISLRRWSANTEFEALVASILRNLPLREPSLLSARSLAEAGFSKAVPRAWFHTWRITCPGCGARVSPSWRTAASLGGNSALPDLFPHLWAKALDGERLLDAALHRTATEVPLIPPLPLLMIQAGCGRIPVDGERQGWTLDAVVPGFDAALEQHGVTIQRTTLVNVPLPFRTALLAGFALATEDPAAAIPAMWATTSGMHRSHFRFVLTDWSDGPRLRPLLASRPNPAFRSQGWTVSSLQQT